MSKVKTTTANFEATVRGILANYGDEVGKCVDEAAKKVAKAGAKQITANARSSFGGTGKYAKGWAVTEQKSRLFTKQTIHNKTEYRLAHLLEKGHAKRDGGRVDGRPHIAPVEQEIIRTFEEEIRQKV